MKLTMFCGAAALAIIAAAPVAAQAPRDGYGASSGWDREAFWRGAPASPRERIRFLQRRIDRGVADGSLSRREARNAQHELNDIQRYARRGSWSANRGAVVQQRLDALSQRLRWQRHNGSYGANGGYDRPGDDRRFATNYDATRYYRDGPNYSERRLSAEDEVYRGSDGRYYCKRNDGTTGLIVGGVGGGILGNIIDGGHNRAAGTLIGGALGALAGKSIDQNSDVRCR
ncbi:MAG TPA: glycine zipper 2TM domain-containing protein [Sphingomonas sp.]|nr:glycine zipper 2TM domain-containing protein [Sphingomonas sp.]